ncbi:hypothetical protein BC829DRAFT_426875 [Chytridium lagenaria]|nr:hypothetical protein BC829DRAFT_426875 [Chytridium lagenaria]
MPGATLPGRHLLGYCYLNLENQKQKGQAAGEYPLEYVSPRPDFIQHRISMFDELMKTYKEEVAAKPRLDIKISLPDGRDMDGKAWETTPMDIAKMLSKSLSERVVIAKVDGALWDLVRPFERSCKMELLDFDHAEGKMVFWHSSAHVLGEACELHYGCHLCIGPPIEEGFYYEMSSERTVSQTDYPALESLASKAIKEKQPFERLVVSKENLLKMFQDNKYKVHIINDKIPDGTSTTVYRCGPLIDLCYGPHIPDTGRIKALAVVKNSASYFLGDAKNDSLQRIYGVSFPDTKQMKEYKMFMEEAAKRDHRKIGIEQELFFFNELSPGSCFFLPHGARIYNALLDLQKGEYRKRGFHEVVTPNMYNTKLWETSGHWQNYKKFALKPMNCPHRDRSYRTYPYNEASGALTGLTRVRRCPEMDSCLNFLQHVYGIFGFSIDIKLSTRPEKFLGDIETWNAAEASLKALNKFKEFGFKWELNPGDGAFYGPKLDITISDALRRRHQCATIQLDFQLPDRFKLEYVSDKIVTDSTGKTGPEMRRPVMIHRAVLGSLERMIAILTENYAGKWPFWLSPYQVVVIPKIRNAEIAHFNFIFVVGAEEEKTNSVNVRNRDDPNTKSKGEVKPLDDILPKLLELKASRNKNQII